MALSYRSLFRSGLKNGFWLHKGQDYTLKGTLRQKEDEVRAREKEGEWVSCVGEREREREREREIKGKSECERV